MVWNEHKASKIVPSVKSYTINILEASGRWNKGQEQLTVCNELEIEGGGIDGGIKVKNRR